jgi:phosphoenolpyruvate---glycerone phosphotransferase subunit DhaM
MSTDTQNGKVGLVLVSHSAAIADGLAELVAQVAGPHVPIVTAGGGPDGSFGTDGERVFEALRRGAAGEGGAVVLMDLGSAVLSVRAALAELGPETAERIAVADAPLVEGAIAAGVTASTGADRDAVLAAARGARDVGKL